MVFAALPSIALRRFAAAPFQDLALKFKFIANVVEKEIDVLWRINNHFVVAVNEGFWKCFINCKQFFV